MSLKSEITKQAKHAKEAAQKLALLPSSTKNKALLIMADYLLKNKTEILEANRRDIENSQGKITEVLLDRLRLTEERIAKSSAGVKEVSELEDPVGSIVETWSRPNGLVVKKVRVPLGVVCMIYESRPDVTIDSIALCIKSGNSVILRGGSEAINSNRIIANIMSKAAEEAGIAENCIQFIDTTERKAVAILLRLKKYIDVIIPRGGASLINFVAKKSTIPVIETGEGNCHIYVDEEADIDMATRIIINAKIQRPGTCNSIETLLVNRKIATEFLPRVIHELKEHSVEIRGCSRTKRIVPEVKKATVEDWKTEYLDLIIAVRVVNNIDEAIRHINKYGTKHSEAIISKNNANIEKFMKKVDAAVVYSNASTRFTDGNQLGLGAEIGISTQKLHARGPMSVKELTSIKLEITGNGQIRE